jgi:hypothetical protein
VRPNQPPWLGPYERWRGRGKRREDDRGIFCTIVRVFCSSRWNLIYI